MVRVHARQWRFFQACLERLIDFQKESAEFDGLPAVQAAQLKFEVEDKLRRYYLRNGRPVRFVFKFVHASDLVQYGFDEDEHYPSVAGYCVLVRDVSADVAAAGSASELRAYLERVVAEAMDAEFRSYAGLPAILEEELAAWFCTDGPAYREIINLLNRHRQRGWIISNAWNPSTKRLLSLKVRRIQKKEATVGTLEYWYLRWWDAKKQSYVYFYRETNRQTYVLHRLSDGSWKVYQNLRPSPRSSAPHRRVKRWI